MGYFSFYGKGADWGPKVQNFTLLEDNHNLYFSYNFEMFDVCFFFVFFPDFIAYRASNRFLQLVKLNRSRMSLSTCCGHIMLHQAYPFIITVKPALKGSIIFPIN
jgi:hypothetical protein